MAGFRGVRGGLRRGFRRMLRDEAGFPWGFGGFRRILGDSGGSCRISRRSGERFRIFGIPGDFVGVRRNFAAFGGFRCGPAGFRGVRGSCGWGFAGCCAMRRDLAEVPEDSGGFRGILEDPAKICRIQENISGFSGFAGVSRILAGISQNSGKCFRIFGSP